MRDRRPLRVIRAVVILDVVLIPVSLVAPVVLGRYQAQYGTDVSNLVLTAGTVVQLGVAAAVGLRRPSNRVAWLLLASVTAGLLDSAILQPFVIYSVDVTHRAVPGGDFVGTFEQMMWLTYVVPLAVFLPLIFPSGELLSRRWRVVVWISLIAMVVGFLGGSLASSQDPKNLVTGVRPVAVPGIVASMADIMQMALVVLPLCILAGVVSMGLRYRRGGAEERHQLKWLIAAVALYLVGFGASIIPTLLGHQIVWLQQVAVLGLALIPVAAAVAVLKYRLYDIDLVISRALVYGALAAFISTVYVAIVVGVGALVGSGGRPNLFLSILATAVVAVAFQPVRERLQRIANRLVYGKRATPYEVLSEFSSRVAESYVGGEVLPRMAQVLAEGAGGVTATVWLRSAGDLRAAATYPAGTNGYAAVAVTGQLLPDLPGASRSVAVRHQGELLGALTVAKRPGEELTPIEEKLVDDLAQQAGLVLKNVGLTSDLQERVAELRASRQRLVQAQDGERRRLERNLHDGAQQHLVALKVKLGLAEALLGRDRERGMEILQQLKGDADEALETLRDLARGIYPPLLADRGLVAAVESQARKAPVQVEVRGDGVGRYPQDVEAALYFCCLEALQNIGKYAEASRVQILLTAHEGLLTCAVTDDGRGFDMPTTARGSGLQNMADRMDALGGEVVVTSTPGAGTSVVMTVPLAAIQPGVAAA